MFCGRVKWLRRSDLSWGCSAENPDIDYEEEWWERTILLESNTNAEWLWFNSVDRETVFRTWIQLLGSQPRHPSTPYSYNTPQSFSRGTRPYTFPKSTKHVYRSLACTQDFSKICLRAEFCCVVLLPRRNRTGYHPALVQLFLRHLRVHSSWEAKQRNPAVVGSFTPVSLFVYEDDQFTVKLCAISI